MATELRHFVMEHLGSLVEVLENCDQLLNMQGVNLSAAYEATARQDTLEKLNGLAQEHRQKQTHTRMCMRKHPCTHTHACMRKHMYTYTHTRAHTHTHTHTLSLTHSEGKHIHICKHAHITHRHKYKKSKGKKNREGEGETVKTETYTKRESRQSNKTRNWRF